MKLGIDPKIDFAFKWVFGRTRNEQVLVHFLNAVIKPQRPIVRATLLNPFNEKEFDGDKLSVLDVKVQDENGRLYNIEIQMHLVPHFCERILYYWANMFRQQIREGEDYRKLNPVISICLVNDVLFAGSEAFHSVFELIDQHTSVRFSRHLQIHVIEFPKFQVPVDRLGDTLEKWVYLLRNAEEMETDELPQLFNEPVFGQAMREWEMLTQDDLERERYWSRMKAIMDEATWKAAAEEAARIAALAPDREKIDAYINPRSTTVSSILRHVRHGRVRSVYSIGDAEAEVLEAQVLKTAQMAGKFVRDIGFPEGVLMGPMRKGDTVIIPNGNTRIEEGDIVTFFALSEDVPAVERLLQVSIDYF